MKLPSDSDIEHAVVRAMADGRTFVRVPWDWWTEPQIREVVERSLDDRCGAVNGEIPEYCLFRRHPETPDEHGFDFNVQIDATRIAL